MTPTTTAADVFLRKVRQGLASLPTAEQEDLVAELRSHVLERQSQGSADPLAGFGPPEQLAADVVAEYALRGGLAQGTSWALSKALFVAARDSAMRLLWLLPLLTLQLVALCLLLAAALKPFVPDLVGVWMGEGKFFAGIVSSHANMREVLGWWAIPAFASAGILLFWLSTKGMIALAQHRLKARGGARS